jgi:hypothetical protein
MFFFSFFKGEPYFATAFEPTDGAMKVAHHMRLFSCAPGKSERKKNNFSKNIRL